MYQRILVPLDGSALAEQALPHVRQLAASLGARVELLMAFASPADQLVDPERGLYVDRLSAAARDRALAYMEQIAGALRRDGLKVACTAREGDAAEHIVTEAEREPATLTAMTTHGRSGITRWALGSVTDKVLRAGTTPLLVARSAADRPSEPAALQTMVVPLDGSEASEAVLPHAAAVARALHVPLLLARVTPRRGDYLRHFAYGDVPGPGTISEDLDRSAQDYLTRIREQLEADGLDVEDRLLHGSVDSALLELLAGVPGPLVAMATHGRGGIGRWVLGSVTDRVIRLARAPVLAVPPIRATASEPETVPLV